jgi:hypothetical protein
VIHEAALLAGVKVGPCPFVDEAVVQCSLENILAAGKEQNEELTGCQKCFVWWRATGLGRGKSTYDSEKDTRVSDHWR